MTRQPTCPDASVLERLLRGLVTDEEAAPLEEHVEGCDACLQTLRGLGAGEGQDGARRGWSSVEEAAADGAAAAEDLIRRMKALRPSADGTGEALAPLPSALSIPGYEILGVLGRGGMGVVYRARHRALNRVVALKMVLSGGHAGEDELARFRREAEAVAQLQHPNIVQVYEVGEAEGRPFFALEYCAAGSLAGRLAGTPLPPEQAAPLVETLARAVQAAHECGVIHRDLKPANVLLAGDPAAPLERLQPKVTDFGLAKKLDDPAGQTRSGVVMGTPSYMAPEQASGSGKAVGPAADIYSLGALLYELLTGRPPFRAATTGETLRQVGSDEPVPPRRLQPKVPRDLNTICLKCLEKEPAKRYASAQGLADDLHHWLKGEPIVARPVSWAEWTWRWCRRNPALALACAAAAALLAVSLVTFARSRDQALRLAYRNEELAKKAERRLAENYFDVGVRSGNREEYGLGMLFLVRALEVCPDDAGLQNQIRLGLGRFALAAPQLKVVLNHPPEFPVAETAAAALSPDGKVVLTAGDGGGVSLWDAGTGRLVGQPLPHPDRVRALAFRSDGKWCATGCNDGNARVWDVSSHKLLLTLPHKGPVTAVAFNPEGGTVATGSEDGTVRLWKLPGGEPLRAGPLRHGGAVYAAAFSPDGKTLVTGGADGTARLWNAGTGEPVGESVRHPAAVRAVAFRPTDGREILTGCEDGKARFWLVRDGRFLDFDLPHPDVVQAVTYSPDGNTVLTGCSNHQAQLWERATGRPVGEPLQDCSEVRGVAFGRDGRTILTVSLNGARLWTIPGPLVLRHDQWVAAVAFSPDGRKLLTGSGDIARRTGRTILWDAQTGQALGPATEHRYMVMSVAFSPDGSRFATGSGNLAEVAPWPFLVPAGEARLWDAATGKPLGPPLPHRGSVPAVAFRPGDGHYLLTACMQDQTACLWDTGTGKLVRALSHRSKVVAAAFSPDGTMVATGPYGKDERALLWEAATGKCVGQLPHNSIVPGVAFSPDGRRLLTGSGDYVARLWDLGGAERPRQTFAHRQWIRAVAFHPRNPDLILTGGGDNTARLWDVVTGKQVGPPMRHEGMVLAAAFSPDGTAVATGSSDGTARLWKVPVAVAGEVNRIKLWAQVITGMELDEHDVPHALDARGWHGRREQLRDLGGDPPY
jgi:WD40 repeat protein